jgi:hypothetical protein
MSRALHLWQRARRLLNSMRPARLVHQHGLVNYEHWFATHLRRRLRSYPTPASAAQPAIDVLTLVHDTPAEVLRETARSVFAQGYDRSRWVIWNNGTTRNETLDLLGEIEGNPRVLVRHGAANLGIVRGHAAGLAHCTAEYVGLLDHDDCLTPDALRIMAASIATHGKPPLLYSDEDKLDAAGRRFCPFFKPAWSPALLLSTGYTCHFTVFRRALGLQLGVFTDPAVEGAQDWDLALRFLDGGYEGVHVPEILYSWRVHSESTSGRGVDAKPYALKGQQRCLELSLERRGLTDRFRVVSNPLYPFVDGHWHLEPHGDEQLWRSFDNLIVYVPPGLRMQSSDWMLQAAALFALDHKLAIVGGRVLDAAGRVRIGSPVLGMSGMVGTALAGCAANDIGYFGLSLSPRNVVALQGGPWVARPEALAAISARSDVPPDITHLCIRLFHRGWRIAWTPQISAVVEDALAFSRSAPDDAAGDIASQHLEFLANDPYYGRFLSLEPARAYQLGDSPRRQQGLNWPYALQEAPVTT